MFSKIVGEKKISDILKCHIFKLKYIFNEENVRSLGMVS